MFWLLRVIKKQDESYVAALKPNRQTLLALNAKVDVSTDTPTDANAMVRMQPCFLKAKIMKRGEKKQGDTNMSWSPCPGLSFASMRMPNNSERLD